MKLLLASAVAFLVASPAQAQLATPNPAGVTFGHLHLNVTDIEVHKKLWTEHYDQPRGRAREASFLPRLR